MKNLHKITEQNNYSGVNKMQGSKVAAFYNCPADLVIKSRSLKVPVFRSCKYLSAQTHDTLSAQCLLTLKTEAKDTRHSTVLSIAFLNSF